MRCVPCFSWILVLLCYCNPLLLVRLIVLHSAPYAAEPLTLVIDESKGQGRPFASLASTRVSAIDISCLGRSRCCLNLTCFVLFLVCSGVAALHRYDHQYVPIRFVLCNQLQETEPALNAHFRCFNFGPDCCIAELMADFGVRVEQRGSSTVRRFLSTGSSTASSSSLDRPFRCGGCCIFCSVCCLLLPLISLSMPALNLGWCPT